MIIGFLESGLGCSPLDFSLFRYQSGAMKQRWFQRWAVLFWPLSALALCGSLVFFSSDWVGFAVDEGFTQYAARRFLQGELPYKDFFFLWSPGVIFLHAFQQKVFGAGLGGGRWLLAVFYAAYFPLLGRICRHYGLNAFFRGMAYALLLVWGAALWLIPYSSWYAIAFVLAAFAAIEGRRYFLAGVLFALSFWMKQNIGILSFAGYCLAAAYARHWRPLGFLLAGFLAALLPGFVFFFYKGAGPEFIRQVFLFPLTYRKVMALPFDFSLIGAPMQFMGFWILSLYFLRPQTKSPWKVFILALLLVLFLYWAYEGGVRYLEGFFYFWQLLAWPLSLGFLLAEDLFQGFRRAYWFAALGAFLQLYPRFDFQHFLFGFVLVLPLLVYSFTALGRRYPGISRIGVLLPLFCLLLSGMALELGMQARSSAAVADGTGLKSEGSVLALNREMNEVAAYLRERGLKAGDPVLVVPNATMFYFLSGFRNPTAHNQFFPSYAESYGETQSAALRNFENAGGRFVVWQNRSGAERDVPELTALVKTNYRVARDFPIHFSVWERNP